jgi:frataxin
MSRTALSTLARNASRQFAPRAAIPLRSSVVRSLTAFYPRSIGASSSSYRSFSASRPQLKGLSPETENPQPKEAEANSTASAPANLSAEQYAELSDTYMDALVEKLEQLQEENEGIDVEYSVCSFTSFLISLINWN